MSVYIRGMEMPTGCRKCELMYFDGETDVCPFAGEVFPSDVERSDHCPLIPIPEHGRLIDADALIEHLGDVEYKGAVKRVLIQAPTIIPADKEEQNG